MIRKKAKKCLYWYKTGSASVFAFVDAIMTTREFLLARKLAIGSRMLLLYVVVTD